MAAPTPTRTPSDGAQVTGRDKVISRYRSYHGNTGAAIVATGDWRRVPNEFARGPRPRLRPLPLSIGVLGSDAGGGVSPRAAPPSSASSGRGTPVGRGHPARDHPGHGRRAHAAAGYLMSVREIGPLRHHPHPRRGHAGFARTGEWFALDAFDVRPDLITFAKGVNSGLYCPSAASSSRADLGGLRQARLPRGPDLFRPPRPRPASSRTSRPWRRRASSSTPTDRDRRARPRPRGTRRQARVIGEVRGTGVFWAVDVATGTTVHASASGGAPLHRRQPAGCAGGHR